MEFQASPASHLPRLVEFLVACGKYLGFASGQFVLGGYIARGAVEPYGVVMPHVGFDDVFGLLQVQGCFGADALVFEASVPAFDLAVALGVKRAGTHMGHAAQANELLEVLGDKLRTIVGDESRLCGHQRGRSQSLPWHGKGR